MEKKSVGLTLVGARLSENGYYLRSIDERGIRVEKPNGEVISFFDEVKFAQWSTMELYNIEIAYEDEE